MTTIPDLKSKIAAYLQKQVSDFIVNGIDLLLDAINRSHQYAQMQYDFELMRCSVDVSVNPARGVTLSPAHLHGTSNYVTIKKVRTVYISGGGQLIPINYVNKNVQVADLSLIYHDYEFSQARMWPTMYGQTYPIVVQTGPQLYIYGGDPNAFGAGDVPLVIDVYRFYPDYSTDEDNDFLSQFGDNFLFWGALCQLNYYSKEFVNRQEGNVSPPEKERDTAWADLLAWDGSLILSGDTSVNLD